MRIIINISNNTVKITKCPNLHIITNILRALLMYSLIDFVFIATRVRKKNYASIFCYCNRYFKTFSTVLIPICQDFFDKYLHKKKVRIMKSVNIFTL